MNTKAKLLALLVAATSFVFVSCSDDDDDNHKSFVTETIYNAFHNLYPQIQPYDWEIEGAYIKADFYNGTAHAEAWFTPDGEWVRTETDFHGQLPEPVTAYLQENYPTHVVDEVDWVETPTQNYYEIELEQKGSPDLKVKVTPEGVAV